MVITCTVLTMSTGPQAQSQSYFVQTSKFFSFYLDLHVYKNKFKNLILTSEIEIFISMMFVSKTKYYRIICVEIVTVMPVYQKYLDS